MKKIVRIRIIALVCLLASAGGAWAQITLTAPDGSEYMLNVDGTLTLNSYSQKTGEVVLPSEVTLDGKTYSITRIGEEAFQDCSSLTSIALPSSVKSIEEEAFNGCTGLQSITLPSSVTSIGERAFDGTAWYNNQPDGVVYAGNVVYKYKGTAPTAVTLREGTVGIADYVFENFTGLSSVVIPSSVTRIGYDAFTGTAWYNNQPDGVIYINNIAYRYKGTVPAAVMLQEGTVSISNYMFYNCSSLKSITLPSSVKSIEEGVFRDCSSLTSITLPSSVTNIEEGAFYGCSSLTSIVIPNSVTSLEGAMFANCSSLTSITLPSSVTSIGGYAFADCSSLTSITLPGSVKSIEDGVFYGCSELTSIYALSPTPPSISSKVFSPPTITGCTIYVKDDDNQSIARYKAATGWSGFNKIKKLYPVEVTAAGMASLYLPYAVSIPEGVKAYTGYFVKPWLKLSPIWRDVVPANTAVVIEAAPGTYNFTETNQTGTVSAGDLLGETAETATPPNCYVLSSVNNQLGFYRYTGATLLPNRAYLTLPAGTLGVIGMKFVGSVITGISSAAADTAQPANVYDLQGRCVSEMKKGSLYIVNGKKTIYQ